VCYWCIHILNSHGSYLLVVFNCDSSQPQICTTELWNFRAMFLVFHMKTLTVVTSVKFKVIVLKKIKQKHDYILPSFLSPLIPSYEVHALSYLKHSFLFPLSYWDTLSPIWHCVNSTDVFSIAHPQHPAPSFHPYFPLQTCSNFLNLILKTLTRKHLVCIPSFTW
jgi:hypothetical protein